MYLQRLIIQLYNGKYTPEKRLQKGYSGEVFQGHFNNKIPVVIKCCKKFFSWRVETFALQQLKHKNIIKLVEYLNHMLNLLNIC